MDEQEKKALTKLLASRNVRDIAPEAVQRVFSQALSRYGRPKEADKAARDQLHQMTGAFMAADELRAARKLLERGAPLDDILALHASTRERPGWRDAYARVFSVTGRPELVIDLACGLNPLCLGALGVHCRGFDVSRGAIGIVNEYARREGWPVSCAPCDLLGGARLPSGDLALMMKLLPVLERQRSGAGANLLKRVKARWKLVTFPTRTLGGRNVGMRNAYAAWLTEHLQEDCAVRDSFEMDSELYYLLEEQNG